MNRIKELRLNKGISQKDLAFVLNVSAAAFSGYETGKYQADIPTYIKIADFFGVSLDYLLGREDANSRVVELPAPFPEISDRYARLDEIDRVKAMAYIDGLLAGEKYSSSQIKRAAG